MVESNNLIEQALSLLRESEQTAILDAFAQKTQEEKEAFAT